MKKNLLELSVEEFTRVLLDFEETHHVEMKSIDPETGELRKDEIVGTYEQIEDACFGFDSLYEQVKEKLFDYNMDLTKLDIYNYLEHQTSNFMKDKVKIVLWEMKCIYDDYCEVVNEEARLEYLEKGWDIPQRTRHNEKLSKDVTSTDYMQMRCKLYPLRESSYFYAIKLLRKKMDDGDVQLHPKVNNNPELLKLFRNNKSNLSFFLQRCDENNKNNLLVYEVQAVMMAKIVTFSNSEADRTRYNLMRTYLCELGYSVGDDKGSAWNQCMNTQHKTKIPSIAKIYKDHCKV